MNDILTAILDITSIDVLSPFPMHRERGGGSTRNSRSRRTFYIPLHNSMMIPPTPSLQPITTSAFVWNKPRLNRKRKWSLLCVQGQDMSSCCICLEPIKTKDRMHLVQLPCHHVLHLICFVSLLPNKALGSRSMLRCPLCRYEIDRFDLQKMGFLVTVKEMLASTNRVRLIRSLMHEPTMTTEGVASKIKTCMVTSVTDGLVYNACILPIERALEHQKMFIRSLEVVPQIVPENIDASLACHVEVLMRIPPEDPF